MVEVFKTNVKARSHADALIRRIHQTFSGYKANFDLEDCDKILRVQCTSGCIEASSVICLLKEAGYMAEVLPDDAQTLDDWISQMVRPFV